MTLTEKKRYNLTLLLIRVTAGTVVFAHGAQKLFGWFGGYGFEGTMSYFTETVGIPYIFGVLVILMESIGMMALIAGVFGRFIAFVLVIIMLGAIYFDHSHVGFFMDWGGNLAGEGYEYHLLLIALASAIVVNGTGAYSLDEFTFAKRKSQLQTEEVAL